MSKQTYIEDLQHAYLNELQARRGIGKSNKIGGRKTGKGMCGFLLELKMWSWFTGRNRESLGLPKRVYRISHKGVISCEQ